MRAQDSLTAAPARKGSSDGWFSVLGKTRYKFWVLGVILLLAVWSVFTGSVTLKWSAGNLAGVSDEFDSSISENLDILEVEEGEKVVRHMWDRYSQSRARLSRFWLEAFDAAYEYLVSDAPAVRNAAVSEIAKMSLRSAHLDPLALQSKKTSKLRKSLGYEAWTPWSSRKH